MHEVELLAWLLLFYLLYFFVALARLIHYGPGVRQRKSTASMQPVTAKTLTIQKRNAKVNTEV